MGGLKNQISKFQKDLLIALNLIASSLIVKAFSGFCIRNVRFFVIPVKLALYHTVQGLSQQVVSRERESRGLSMIRNIGCRLKGKPAMRVISYCVLLWRGITVQKMNYPAAELRGIF
jgi:hypothetical protein